MWLNNIIDFAWLMENAEVAPIDTDTGDSKMWPLRQRERPYTNKVFPLFGVGAVVSMSFLLDTIIFKLNFFVLACNIDRLSIHRSL